MSRAGADREEEVTPEDAGRPRSLRERLAAVEFTAARVTLAYLVFGFAGLLVSDVVLPGVLADPLLQQVQTVKGFLEVLVTAAFVYAVTYWSRRRLERSNDRLQRLQDERAVLYRVLRHNLRNDINLVAGYAASGKRLTDDPAVAEQFDAVLAATERIESYVDQTRQIHAISDRPNDRRVVDLVDVVERVAAAAPASVTVETDLPDRAPVVAIPHVEGVVAELLDNAVDHGPFSEPTVCVSVSQEGDTVELVVTDENPPIPPFERDAMRRPTEDQLVHASGLGLWFVSLAVRASQGTVSIERTPADDGNRVVVTLPAG